MRKKIFLLTAIIAVVLARLLIIGNRRVEVSRHQIRSDKIPVAFDGFRILQVSDFHNCSLGDKVAEIAKKEKPDMIVITGDFVDAHRTDIGLSLRLADQLVDVAPVYYINGNHEACIDNYPFLKSDLQEAGVCVLTNESREIKKGEETICITGIEDPLFSNAPYEIGTLGRITNTLQNIPIDKEKYNILLSHHPEVFGTYLDYDLVFAGHAHGGQFRIPGVGGLYAPGQGFFPKYDEGEHVSGKTHMLISRGLGNSVIPVRINNNPELIIAELKKE